MRAERLDWIPQRLLAIDAPLKLDAPPELRAAVRAAADRLASLT
ncbi:hypothetical protein [Branchiibius cervicis]|uniref:Quinolinate synthase n=1 Tax=Branchiibius cervicis TaxID=908252 RepID=A0ABW2AVP1_9MICO